nr:sulfatase-like hydrolase/transferase [Candidatus Sigynarchaeota archaeon]
TVDCAMVDGAADFISRYRKKRPFCIYLPLLFPHPHYVVDQHWYEKIDQSKIPPRIPAPDGWKNFPSILKGIWERQHLQGWDEARWNRLRATYYGMCAKVDEMFGQIVATLKKANLYDTTAIFFFSDHGDYTGDYGLVEKNQNTFQDCITRVPLVIKPPRYENKPGEWKRGVASHLVELVDIPATILDFTGIEPGYTQFGRSLVPAMKQAMTGENQQSYRSAVFCEGGRLVGETQAMERESKSSTKPSGLYYPRISLQITDEAPYHGKATMIRTEAHKYVHRLYESDELYDLREDPSETRNVVGDPSYKDVLHELQARMLAWYQETCDWVPDTTDARMFRPNARSLFTSVMGK